MPLRRGHEADAALSPLRDQGQSPPASSPQGRSIFFATPTAPPSQPAPSPCAAAPAPAHGCAACPRGPAPLLPAAAASPSAALHTALPPGLDLLGIQPPFPPILAQLYLWQRGGFHDHRQLRLPGPSLRRLLLHHSHLAHRHGLFAPMIQGDVGNTFLPGPFPHRQTPGWQQLTQHSRLPFRGIPSHLSVSFRPHPTPDSISERRPDTWGFYSNARKCRLSASEDFSIRYSIPLATAICWAKSFLACTTASSICESFLTSTITYFRLPSGSSR